MFSIQKHSNRTKILAIPNLSTCFSTFLQSFAFSFRPVHLFFDLPSVFGLQSSAFHLRFPLAFCFELQYSNRPTHPKTKIAAGLEAGIALGAMTAPPHRGEYFLP